ncbi:MAG: autotransporter-associated beta strand repeat-containing protein [Chthoniobacteraceae bacterium]
MLTLETPNSYSGPTVINGGTIRIDSADALGDGSPTNALIFNGGALRISAPNSVQQPLDLGVGRSVSVGALGGTLSLATLDEIAVPGRISGSGQLRVTGGGKFILKGNNTGFTGDVVVDSEGATQLGIKGGSVLRLDHDQALTSSAVRLIPSTTTNVVTTLELNRVSIGSGVSLALAANTTNGTRLTAIRGTNDWNGAITIEGTGTSNRIGASDGARLNIAGSITGPGGFEKIDGGTVELLGDSNGWTGEIEFTEGTLLVSGNIAGSTVTVNRGILGGEAGTLGGEGGTLGGEGGTLGAVNVNHGTLAPGASIGTLHSGDVNLSGNANFHLEIESNALTTDLLASSGTVSLSLATLTVDDLGHAILIAGERFTFITANSVTGTFADLPDGAPLMVGESQFTIDYTPTSVALVAVPEPGALAVLMAGFGVAMGVRRRRR